MRAKVASHVSPLKYFSLPPSDIQKTLQLKYTWDTLVGHRDFLLLRCGYIQLGHINFRPSYKASIRWCIFCGKRYSTIYAHVFSNCSALDTERALVPFPDLNLFYCNVLEASFIIFPSCCSICSRYRPKGLGFLATAWNVSIKISDGRKWL